MDLPSPSPHPSIWTAAELSADPGSWQLRWPVAAVTELEDAVTATGRQDLAAIAAGRAALPALPAVDEIAATIAARMLHSRGVLLLRGLDIAGRSVTDLERMLALLGSRIGSLRTQNAAGDLIGHVRDVGADVTDPAVRIYQTNARQTFHTDSCDVVVLLCVRTARRGGASLVANVGAIYDEMAATSPALAARLFDPVATDRRGEVPPGADPWFEIPVLSWYAGHLTAIYQRQYIESAQRYPGAPKLDTEHRAALDRFDELANDPRFHVSMAFAPGDLQFVHNHAVLHDRTAFEDWPEPQRRRHLLRLWISLPGDRELPPVFAQRYGSLTVGDRGGIAV